MKRNESPNGLGMNGVIPGAGSCVVVACEGGAPRGWLMCSPHWKLVPIELKRAMNDVMRRWNRNEAMLSDLRDAQWACVEAMESE